MEVVKIVLTSVKLALLIAMIVALFQIKSELSQIKTTMSEQKVCAFAGKMKSKNCKKMKSGKSDEDWSAKKEKIGEGWGNWTATKELCMQKLDKIQELLQTKEFDSDEEKENYAAKFKQLKNDVEQEGADYTDLFKDIKVLIKEIKGY